jgi:hypothetical protein
MRESEWSQGHETLHNHHQDNSENNGNAPFFSSMARRARCEKGQSASLVRPLAGSPLTTISYLGGAEAHVVRHSPIFWTRFDFWRANLNPLGGQGTLIRSARSMWVTFTARGLDAVERLRTCQMSLVETKSERTFYA